ncbi:MAG TPA: hypothetical protein PLQ63_03000 [Propionicimonas sp.]|nr:hypothetical protein [Propionicimonas sp.]
MSTTSPAAPGQLGVAARPTEVLEYLGQLDRWLTERRAELDSLDEQILATGRQAELTSDMALAMALWQAAKTRANLLLTSWDSGRVGQQELERLSAMIWGRLDTTGVEVSQLQSMTVSLPEAGRLCDALVAQLRTRLNTDPGAEQQQIRLRQLRAQAERIRDQIKLEPPAMVAAASAKVDALAARVDELTDKRGRGGDIAGLLGSLEMDAARFERDLIVGSAQRREARDLLAKTREQLARAESNQRAVTALAARVAAAVSPTPAAVVPQLAALGPLPNTPAALHDYALALTRFERELDQAHGRLTQALTEVDATAALLPALQAKAAQHGFADHPDLVELAQLIERRLAQRPLAKPVLQQLLATYSAQLDYLDGGAR